MCGIAGVFVGTGRAIDQESLHVSVARLKHRGPDDSGIFISADRSIGLAHTRLSIQDLSSHGHQPMVSEDGKVILVFNGELYNFQGIRNDLMADGHAFFGKSDSEVLLRLYLDHRKKNIPISDTLQCLNGLFAFTIWDATKGSLLVARDALGVKPLYFNSHDDQFAFASEIKALQPLCRDLGDIDLESVFLYLSHLWRPGSGTMAKKVRKLGPGEALWVRDGKIVEEINWYQLPAINGPHPELGLNESLDGTIENLRRSVHRQMISDVPVGAFLSGGLDSSASVKFAKEKNPDLRCFTIDTGDKAEHGIVTDLPYAKKVARHLNVQLDVIKVDSSKMAAGVEDMVYQLDEPLGDPAPLNVLFISQLARDHDIKVLLSGAGGDDLFSGYRRHYALHLEKWWSWLPYLGRKGLETLSKKVRIPHPTLRRLSKMFSGASLDSNERLVNYFKWLPNQEIFSILHGDIRNQLTQTIQNHPMMDFLSNIPNATQPLEKLLTLEQRFFLTEHNLNYTDKMSMAAGVETRVPFLDLDLVQFASRIPSQHKQNKSDGKWIFKKAMEPHLPREVIYRPKSGFGAPLVEWLSHDLKDLLSDLLSEESVKNRGIFDYQGIQALRQKSSSGRLDCSYVLFTLLCVEIWLRKFND